MKSEKIIMCMAAALLAGMVIFTGCASNVYIDTTDEEKLINEAMRDADNYEITYEPETEEATDSIDTAPETIFETSSEETMLYKPEGVIRVCVDAGHGFVDGGTGPAYLPDGMVEKDVTIDVANRLKEDLTAYGFDVVMTHDGVTFPITSQDDGNQIYNPFERVAYANTLNLDYFISIHCNSYDQDETVNGIRIYYNEKSSSDNTEVKAASAALAASLRKTLTNEKEAKVLGMSDSEAYYVTRKTNATAILVEMGFVTNKNDAEKMSNDEWKEAFAQALADGIKEYYGK